MTAWRKANPEKWAIARAASREKDIEASASWHVRNKEYTNNRRLLQTYGITAEQKQQLLESQGNVCAICKGDPGVGHIDHCHTTGKVRGILCQKCNTGLGLFNDKPELLQQALEYLKCH